jgi:hypothetical protein
MQFICYEIPVEPLILIPEYTPEEQTLEFLEEEIQEDDLLEDLDSTQNP